MAITYTTRFGLPQWGDPTTDGPTHEQFNAAMLNVEQQAAHDAQGTLALRPAPGNEGNYWWATDTDLLYRDDGTAWTAINDHVNKIFSNNTDPDTPLSVLARSTSTGKLFTATKSGDAQPELALSANGLLSLTDNAGEQVVIDDAVNKTSLSVTNSRTGTGSLAKFTGGAGYTGQLSEWYSGTNYVANLDTSGNLRIRNLTALDVTAQDVSVSTLEVAGASSIGAALTLGGDLSIGGNIIAKPTTDWNTATKAGLYVGVNDGTSVFLGNAPIAGNGVSFVMFGLVITDGTRIMQNVWCVEYNPGSVTIQSNIYRTAQWNRSYGYRADTGTHDWTAWNMRGGDTGWVNITSFHSGWTVPDVAQVRQIGNEVIGRGNLQHLTFAPPNYAAVANLPAGIGSPQAALAVFDAPGNTTAVRRWAVESGVLSGYASAASAAWYSLAEIRYRTD